jgi:hypothetical protein
LTWALGALAVAAAVAIAVVVSHQGSSSAKTQQPDASAAAASAPKVTDDASTAPTRQSGRSDAAAASPRPGATHESQPGGVRGKQVESLARLISQSESAGTPARLAKSAAKRPHHHPHHGPNRWVTTRELVQKHEALPCTGPHAASNFEVFSAGASVAGLELSGTARRCDPGAAADEAPANYVSYIYGECEISPGATGCREPLEVQTWPACQRSLANYTFEGKPMPYKVLGKQEGAEVVEILFPYGSRIEVYSKSSTIVIFASESSVAQAAVESLTAQEVGEPPATQAAELTEENPGGLGPPAAGAMEGDLKC